MLRGMAGRSVSFWGFGMVESEAEAGPGTFWTALVSGSVLARSWCTFDTGEAGVFSARDSTYFLPSGMRRRGMSVANAGTKAIPIWILQTASSSL
jgi:hypothetical protein